jgi:hypothetical protein
MRFYEMLHSAKDPKAIDQWGQRINERESFLLRSAQNRLNRQGRGGKKKEAEESAPTAANLDISNLAPHADEIAKEVFDTIKGFWPDLPENVAGFDIKGTIAQQIKQNPAVVKDLYARLDGMLRKYLPPPGGGGAQGQLMGPGGLDPEHPESWPKEFLDSLGLAGGK